MESGDFATRLHVYRWCAYLQSILKLRSIHKDNGDGGGGGVDNEIKDGVLFSVSFLLPLYIKVGMTSPGVAAIENVS